MLSSARRPVVLCAGIAVEDFIFKVDRFPEPGAKVQAAEFIATPGGCAANAAVAVARLGGEAHFAGPIGTDAASGRVMATVTEGGSEPQAATGEAAAAGGGLHPDVEAIFRSHPIVSPKLDRIDWPSADRARVLLREFPMDGMPPMVREKFTERIRTGIRDSRARNQVGTPVTVELVDAASGRVMATVTE